MLQKRGMSLENRNEVRKNFGRRAANYRLSATHGNKEDLERMISLLNPAPAAAALDVATGGGHTAAALSRYVRKVTAVDITPEMLKEASLLAGQCGAENIVFQIADVHSLPFPGGEFDIVVSRFAPHHFYDIKKALQEMCRVLKPGGLLYILDCSVYDGEETEKEINRLEYLRDNSHRCSYSPRQWQKLLDGLPIEQKHAALLKQQYNLPEWFDRMEVNEETRQEVFRILAGLSEKAKALYPYGQDFITTYRFELLAEKL